MAFSASVAYVTEREREHEEARPSTDMQLMRALLGTTVLLAGVAGVAGVAGNEKKQEMREGNESKISGM